MGADVLAPQGVGASPTMILSMLDRNSSVAALKGLLEHDAFHSFRSKLFPFIISLGNTI